MPVAQSPARRQTPAKIPLACMAVCGTLALALCLSLTAQQNELALPATTTPETPKQAAPDATQNPTPPPAPAAQTAAPAAAAPLPGEITEDELKHMLLGKQLFLRGGYMDNDLNFNEMGLLIGHSPRGSFTLNEIQIDKVRLTKHKLELEGTRFGCTLRGHWRTELSSAAVEPLRITPKKKVLKITVDREQVLVRKTKKEAGAKGKGQNTKLAPVTTAATPSAAPPAAAEPSDADQLKAQIAAAPAAERPGDPASVTTTYSPAHAAKLLGARSTASLPLESTTG